eukprot:scaffold3043_cov360-Prasinococcus_capsulatus_cf.AAC.19
MDRQATWHPTKHCGGNLGSWIEVSAGFHTICCSKAGDVYPWEARGLADILSTLRSARAS